jgi:A/G-specific adenine glycosylase
MSSSAWPLKPRSLKNKTFPPLAKQTRTASTKQTPIQAAGDEALPFFDWVGMGLSLLAWYGQRGRDLPWRRSRDPYAIWISEIMLQQTQVKTVLPYFDRWLTLFPTIQTLAVADQQQVLKAWEGLGYYSRARNLHRTAQIVMQEFGGQFPKELDPVLKLPGIGRTTAGGILSAAFDLPLPILDGNVKRVIARLVALEVPPGEAIDRLWAISERLVPKGRGRDFNQAFMDLGATVCTPKNPDCPSCPWQTNCQAYARGLQTQVPKAVLRSPLPHKQIAILMAENGAGEVLIIQRPQVGLLAGLWDFPQVEGGEAELRGAFGDLAIEPLVTVNHAYTHFKVTFQVYRAKAALQVADGLWLNPALLKDYPFPKSHLKMIQAFLQGNSKGDF